MQLLKLADAGDKDALEAVKRAFDADPGLVEKVGDLAARVEEAVIRLIVGEQSHGLREAVVRKVGRHQSGPGGGSRVRSRAHPCQAGRGPLG